MKEQFYVEITDERVDLDPPYVYQSCTFGTKEEAVKFGRRLVQKIGRSDISFLRDKETKQYLNPDWEYSAKGVKKCLHVDVMRMEIYNDDAFGVEYEIYIEENLK